MPLARYFFLVGGVLLALVFISDFYLPKSPVAERVADIDRQVIRIHSDRKWPERIVFDTNLPTVTPAPAQALASVAPAPAPPPTASDEAQARVRESFAQLPLPSESRHVHVADPFVRGELADRHTVSSTEVDEYAE